MEAYLGKGRAAEAEPRCGDHHCRLLRCHRAIPGAGRGTGPRGQGGGPESRR